MVVLYPQAQGSERSGEGCWNWEAYGDDANFDTREGKQLGMVARITANLTSALSRALVSTGGELPKQVQKTHNDNDYFYGSYSCKAARLELARRTRPEWCSLHLCSLTVVWLRCPPLQTARMGTHTDGRRARRRAMWRAGKARHGARPSTPEPA